MGFFAVKPEVAAYKNFAKDDGFKRVALLSREIKVLEVKQGAAHAFGQRGKEARLETRINAKTVEIKTLKQGLAEKYNLQTVLAGFEEYSKGFASGMKVAGGILKVLVPTLTIGAGLFILTAAALQPSFAQAWLSMLPSKRLQLPLLAAPGALDTCF
ncbi:MAG: hypothetical protein NTX79_08325 [Candidatus Micrarchaeota archaeon]|nr:hypothetical protein [Candidatus Micrarchaeota archaeon]